MELSKQPVLLVGGGEVAERKLDLLLKANAKLTLVSPEFTAVSYTHLTLPTILLV